MGRTRAPGGSGEGWVTGGGATAGTALVWSAGTASGSAAGWAAGSWTGSTAGGSAPGGAWARAGAGERRANRAAAARATAAARPSGRTGHGCWVNFIVGDRVDGATAPRSSVGHGRRGAG